MAATIPSRLGGSQDTWGDEMSSRGTQELGSLTTSELVALFEELSLAESEASANFDHKRARRVMGREFRVLSELRRRPRDERSALFALYTHSHPGVRLCVAESTYALDPQRANAVMREIAESRLYPWAAQAGMSLRALANGTSELPKDPELRIA